MIAVIIAGGSGTRLWPLSTPDYPKHLLSLTGRKSLLQYTYERAQATAEQVYVVTDASHASHVKQQLPKLADKNIIIEPGRRGTASCIVAALVEISRSAKSDETIAFMHADHYIRDTAGFTYTFRTAEEAGKKTQRIVLVGVEPDHAATGFGYIQKGAAFDEKKYVFNVEGFKEKPDHKKAQEYLESGNYLWNCGYFLATLQTFLDQLKEYAPALFRNYQELLDAKTSKDYKKIYLNFENVPIDYALIEKTPKLLVVPASFDWMDVGAFPDVHKVNMQDEDGNTVHGLVATDSISNSYIRNDTDIPAAVIGLDNIAVVMTKDGLLITNKSYAQRVGEVSKKLQN